jgi:Amt family ammonium transporter
MDYEKVGLNPRKTLLLISAFLSAFPAWGVENNVAELSFTTHNLWILLATCLVFMMHLGFASLEAGMTQSKNTVNILFKNTGVMAIGLLTYALCGFNLMYPGADFAGSFFGFSGFGIDPGVEGLTPAYNEAYTYYTDFIFQAMFAATAATIVSGAVCERIKLSSFLIFSTVFVGLAYPVIGMWKWGGGFLETMKVPFYDFAGSSLVHSVGGWAALAGVICLGPRLGKYGEGKKKFIPHNYPLAVIGVFLLWLGWFGFNGGSVLSAEPASLSLVFVTTALAGAAGLVGAMSTSWIISKRPDLGMALNGSLAGLVGITAGADQMGVMEAIVIGLLSGLLVVVSINFIDKKLKLDDPVGAISVHLVCGIWGTLAVGLFGKLASGAQLISQLKGILAIALAAFIFSFSLFKIIDAIMGLRVSREEEIEGLDISEHGEVAYLFSYNSFERDSDEFLLRNGKKKDGEYQPRLKKGGNSVLETKH